MPTTPELLREYEAPFVPFPENPKLIFWKGMPAYEYIPFEQFNRQLLEISQRLDFDQFDLVAYNKNGGKFPAELLTDLKSYKEEMLPIEYHMAKNGKPVEVKKRIPEMLKYAKILVIEDVFDSGHSFQRMKEDCPDLWMVVMSLKVGVPNQVIPENVIPVFKTVNLWQAGMGMNIDFGEDDPFYQKDSFRNYLGIVIRPQDDVLDKYYQQLVK